MSLEPLRKSPRRSVLFPGSGAQTAKLSLFQAIFFERTDPALKIIETDPEQINLQEPFAALTSLHLAIFRQNVLVVQAICRHPITSIHLEDRFGRKPIDMCLYTRNDQIFSAVLERSYRKAILELETDGTGTVVAFKDR